MNIKASKRLCKLKNAKTNNMTNVPRITKNTIDGKICLCSTRRVIDKIDDVYDTTTKVTQNAGNNTNDGFSS